MITSLFRNWNFPFRSWRRVPPGRSYKAFPTLVVKASSMVGGFFFDNHKRLILMTERGLEFYTGKECRMIMLTSAAFGAADLSKGISADGDFLGGKIYTAQI
ncbi:MAG: hypothetical protein B6241_11055 [Spirochaetaceae bacterium 4572_59]|nr:MAG: hypothetical protein B6241_11055 [Spirochaetaceae bacterium 4572_59]